jgi:hypothetical protein
MKKYLLAGILLFVLILESQQVFSQILADTTSLFSVETKDGNEFTGNLISKDSIRIILWTSGYGRITIPIRVIEKMNPIVPEKIIAGKFWFENPQSSRYLWVPNGYGLKKGEGYYQNIWVLWNQASYGLTDYFSIGAGIIPLFLFGAGEYSPVWIVPKFSIPIVKEKFNIGIGGITGKLIAEDNSGFGILYGTATVGNRNNNFSFGMGYGYASGEWAEKPMYNISFMARTGPRGYFLSENYYLTIDGRGVVLLSLGGRSFVKKVGIDYGLFIPLAEEMETFIALPWLGITVPIVKKISK